MYAVLAVIVHTIVSVTGAVVIAPYSIDPIADGTTLATLCIASAVISGLGFVATSSYLSRRMRPISGVLVGLLCGVLCIAMISFSLDGMDFSLVLFLTILTPTLLAVWLTSMLDQPKSGWL